MEINFENCSNYSGWVKKKASKVMVGWQKRFFRIIQGKVILYSEKEDDDNPKGQIMISAINQAVAIDKNQFQLTLGTKCFHLKTKEPEKRDEWVKVINFLVEYNAQNKKQKVVLCIPSHMELPSFPPQLISTFVHNLQKLF